MACFYQMSELPVPFAVVSAADRQFYTLRVCKDCRADWMGAISDWFASPSPRESTGTGVFVRERGACVELTGTEIRRRQEGLKP